MHTWGRAGEERSLSRVRSDHCPDCVFALPGRNVVSFLHAKEKKISGYFEFANAAISFICTEATQCGLCKVCRIHF